MVTSDSLGYQTMVFNLANGPRAKAPIGTDPRLRRAFELSIDRDALLQVVYNGLYAGNRPGRRPQQPLLRPRRKTPRRGTSPPQKPS